MKKTIISILITITTTLAFAQHNIGIGTNTPTNKLEVVSTVVSQFNATIVGTNNGVAGSGISGISDSEGTTGVQGTSNFGVGLYGFSNSNTGIAANAASGTAIYASSVIGIALSVSGKLNFRGLNTNPSDGAVLTSDASGNAVWKAKRIGFSANGVANTTIPISTFRKAEFSTESFDPQNNFVPYPGSASPSTSVFTAPVAGIYHFATSLLFERSTTLQSGQIRLVKNSSSNLLANHESLSGLIGNNYYYVSLEIAGDFFLDVNDKVWVEVAQRNIFGTAAGLNTTPARGRFSGYLKIAN